MKGYASANHASGVCSNDFVPAAGGEAAGSDIVCVSGKFQDFWCSDQVSKILIFILATRYKLTLQ
jgi:hypothetical protein